MKLFSYRNAKVLLRIQILKKETEKKNHDDKRKVIKNKF